MRPSFQNIPEIIVSCQSRPNQPFYADTYVLKKMIDSVVLGGARALRLDGSELIEYSKKKYPSLFVLGFKKVITKSSPAFGWITPDIKTAKEVLRVNPDAIILDGSVQLHTDTSLRKLIGGIRKINTNILIGCDIGTEEEGVRAMDSGSDFILTTQVEAETRQNKSRNDHLRLIRNLLRQKIPVICEGGIVTEEDVGEFLSLGARSMVIGKAIVDPVFNTKRFVKIPDLIRQQKLLSFFIETFTEVPISCKELSPHGSTRRYFLIKSQKHIAIGTTGEDWRENKAFVQLSDHLFKKGIRVPKVLKHSEDFSCYLQEYCGAGDLFADIKTSKQDSLYKLLCPAIDLLHDFQKNGTRDWNFSNSYPYQKFDEQEVDRDFKRFIKKFVDNLSITFSSQKLKKDYQLLVKEILKIPSDQYVLMHRDFQSRNILLHKNKCILIDFQSARKGPPQYDLVSFLYQSQVNYSEKLIDSLIDYYISKNNYINKDEFHRQLYTVGILRIIQSIGSYGIAGLEQKKEYFLKSIPFALKNMKTVLGKLQKGYGLEFPELENIINKASQIKTYEISRPSRR